MLIRFWEQGHQVVGVECAQQAIDDFAKFNNIKFNTDKLPDVSDAKVFEVNYWEISWKFTSKIFISNIDGWQKSEDNPDKFSDIGQV